MMIKGYQGELLSLYEKIRDTENNELKVRRKEIESLFPEIIELDNKISKLSIQLSMKILKSKNAEDELKKSKDEIMDLKAKKCEMLVSKGYPQDFLNLHYRCSKCRDTGYIGVNRCSCFKDKLVRLYYKDSDLEEIVKDCNFDKFDMKLFPTHRMGNEKYSSRKNMENILEYVLNNYIPNFKDINTNLLFFGNPGSGKSFLSYCIAKELLDRGNLVVYKTSEEVIKMLRDIKFNNNKDAESLLLNCDLLIIDDLGAEAVSDFSITEFFNLLNTKLLKKNKMLINTNLDLPDINKLYSERIYSRLIGNFKLFNFYSDDIRIKLNLAKN